MTCRSEPELQARFGRAPQGAEDPQSGGRYQVESYLDHHAAKLVRRFDAASYVVLTQAMNGHDVGRSRGGTRAALRRVTAETLVAGVDSDRLYPLAQQAEPAAGIPGADHPRSSTPLTGTTVSSPKPNRSPRPYANCCARVRRQGAGSTSR